MDLKIVPKLIALATSVLKFSSATRNVVRLHAATLTFNQIILHEIDVGQQYKHTNKQTIGSRPHL